MQSSTGPFAQVGSFDSTLVGITDGEGEGSAHLAWMSETFHACDAVGTVTVEYGEMPDVADLATGASVIGVAGRRCSRAHGQTGSQVQNMLPTEFSTQLSCSRHVGPMSFLSLYRSCCFAHV